MVWEYILTPMNHTIVDHVGEEYNMDVLYAKSFINAPSPAKSSSFDYLVMDMDFYKRSNCEFSIPGYGKFGS